MPYADYSYYKEAFGGTALSQQEFDSCCEKAGSYIDYLTLGKAGKNLTSSVKNAVCAAAEEICKNNGKNGIKSESADGYSVTYCTADSGSSELVRVFEAVKIYLEPTGLLYCGMNGGGESA